MVCPDCNNKLPDNSTVCNKCGHSFRKNQSRRRRINKTRVRIVVISCLILLVFILVAIIAGAVSKSKGTRYLKKLSKMFGCEWSEIEDNFKGTLLENPSYDFLTDIEDTYSYVCESEKITNVAGTTVPQWVIFCSGNADGILTQLIYYDFRVLEDNFNGQKISDVSAVETVSTAMAPKDVERISGLSPYIIIKHEGKTETRYYRYFYTDPETQSQISNYLIVDFDANGLSASVSTAELNYINAIVSKSAQPANDVTTVVTTTAPPETSAPDDDEETTSAISEE